MRGSWLAILAACFCAVSINAPARALTTYSCGTKTYTDVPISARPLCSVNFTFTGACDGTDQVTQWSQIISTNPSGPLPSGTWNLKPWEDQWTTIVYMMLTKDSGGPTSTKWQVGNNYVTDIMLTLPAGETSKDMHYLMAGGGWSFPPKSTAPTNAYLDLHGSCTGGGSVQLTLHVQYIPEGWPASAPGYGVVFQAPLDSDSGHFSGYTAVQRFEASSLIAPPGSQSEAKVTWQATGAGLTISSAYICEAASSGDPYDCATAPTPLTVSGLTGTATFAWGKTAPVLVRWYMSGSADQFKFKWSQTGAQGYYKAANDGATQNLSGYTAGAALLGISKIEMNGF